MGSLLPIVLGFAFVAYFAYVKLVVEPKKVAAANETYKNMIASDVASRLGLGVVEGDPSMNLMMLHHGHVNADMKPVEGDQGFWDAHSKSKTTGVAMRGAPNGRNQEFVYRLETEGDYKGRIVKTTIHFALTTQVNSTFPPFEVVLAAPNTLLKPKLHYAFPTHPTGVPQVDAKLRVHTQDPRVAQLLGPLLVPFVDHTYVHVVGTGDRILLLADHTTSSYATYFLDANAKLHHDAAATFENFARA